MSELKVKTSIDGSGWTRGLEKMEEDAANFGRTVNSKIAGNFNQAIMGIVPGLTSAIGGIFAADQIKEAVAGFLEKGEKIEFGSIRLNVDPQTFQRIDNVMTEVGQSTDTASAFMDKLAVSMTAIEAGRDATGQLREAFADLGVTSDDLAKKDYQKIFFQIAESMKGIAPSKEQVAALREIGGRGGDAMLPAFQIGFDSTTARAGLLSSEDLERAKGYNEEMRDLKAEGADITKNVGSGTMSFLEKVALATVPGEGEVYGKWQDHLQREKSDATKRERENLAQAKEARVGAVREHLAQQHKLANERQDADDRKKAANIDKETRALEERNRVAGLTPEAKRLELLRQIAMAQGELDYGGGDLSKADEAAMRRHIVEMKGELAAIKVARPAAAPHQALSHLGNQAIGGILLGHDRLREMATHARATAAHTAQIARNTAPRIPGRGAGDEFP